MSFDLRDIANDEFRNEIQESLSLATRFGVVFLDKEGNQIGPVDTYTNLCKAINSTEEGRKACVSTNCQAINMAFESKEASIYICHAGLVNIEIPLIFDGDHIGSITAGQVICDEDCYPKDPHQINWAEREGFKDLYSEVPVLSREQIEATTTALKNISHYIIQRAAYQKAQEELTRQKELLLVQDRRHAELEQQLAYARFDALQKQITPHFLFNVFNSASRLISLEEYSTAQTMLNSFAQMLRYTLQDATSIIPLAKEMDYINNYLRIQSIRFENRINYKVIINDKAKQLDIPFFSLQPFVENAVEHGLLPCASKGSLIVKVDNENNSFTITISDDGAGMDPGDLNVIRSIITSNMAPADGRHIGMYNSYHRLKIMYGDNLSFNINSHKGKGTEICINISC